MVDLVFCLMSPPSFSADLIPPGVCNLLNPSTIYANNEVDLDEVDIYGFDYDYTLALYSNTLDTMIYNTARDFLVKHYKVCLMEMRCCLPHILIQMFMMHICLI